MKGINKIFIVQEKNTNFKNDEFGSITTNKI